MIIMEFRGSYSFLSNFYKCDILYDDIMYPSVEHAFQAQKTLDISKRKFISALPTPSMAKAEGRNLILRLNWEEIKLQIMEDLLRIKFNQKYFKQLLLATNDDELIEGNWWNDTFWGVYRGKGYNHLGRLLMKIRAELRNE